MKWLRKLNACFAGNLAEAQFSRSQPPFLLSVVLAAALVPQSPGQVILTNNNSEAHIDPASSTGMSYWGIRPGPFDPLYNLLYQQWFWYRVGSTGPEQPVNFISTPVLTEQTASTLRATYSDSLGRFKLSIKYALTGGAPGTGLADMIEEIGVTNISGSTLTFHLFQYSDFDMFLGNDSLLLSKDGTSLRFSLADQSDIGASEIKAVPTPFANRGEAGVVPSTLARLNNASADDLLNTTTASGNVAWAWQWVLNIGAGTQSVISVDGLLRLTSIASGGVVQWGASTVGARQTGYFYLFKVDLPPAAVANGAGWKLQGAPDYSYTGDYTSWFAPTGGVPVTSFPLEFRQAAGYATPPPVVVNFQSSTNFENNVQITTIPANYVLLPPPKLANVRLVGDDRLGMTLQGIANRVYSLQYCTNLVNWRFVSLLTNHPSGTFDFTNSLSAGSARGFYRVKEGTN
jgi:hypothetical protein